MPVQKKWYTVKEMQERTGLSRTTLWKMSKREPFKRCFKKVGSRLVRIDAAAFDEVLNTYEAS